MSDNIVVGTILEFDESVFEGSYPRSKFSHTSTHKVEVISEKYGGKRGQHTFTLKVLESDERPIGSTFKKMGRNLYPTSRIISQPENLESLEEDKKERAEEARFNKYLSWYQEAIFEGKESKLDKIPEKYLEMFREEYSHSTKKQL